MAGYRPSYTLDEDTIMLNYIIENQAYYKITGNNFWKKLESEGILDRTWQSLRNRFLKSVLPNISNSQYKIPEIEKRKIGLAHYQLTHEIDPHQDSHSETDSDIEVVNDKKNNKEPEEDTNSNSSFEFTL